MSIEKARQLSLSFVLDLTLNKKKTMASSPSRSPIFTRPASVQDDSAPSPNQIRRQQYLNPNLKSYSHSSNNNDDDDDDDDEDDDDDDDDVRNNVVVFRYKAAPLSLR